MKQRKRRKRIKIYEIVASSSVKRRGKKVKREQDFSFN